MKKNTYWEIGLFRIAYRFESVFGYHVEQINTGIQPNL